jgi:hypothetical protein
LLLDLGEMEQTNSIKTYEHGGRKLEARIMEKDEVWTTVMEYRDGKAYRPLTVRTKSLREKTDG